MPGLNGTGPQGQGPMTGRAMGRCNTANGAGVAGQGFAMGMGSGRGRGRGFRFNNPMAAPQNVTSQDRISELESQIAGLQQELTALRQHHENSDHQR